MIRNPGSDNEDVERGQIATFVKEKFKKRTCKRFVEDPDAKDSSICCCGYSEYNHDDNVKRDNEDRKWDVMNDTVVIPTDAFGEMEFLSSNRNISISKYIRVDYKTNVNDLLKFMLDHWKLEKPNLLISVTGGAQNFTMKPRLKEIFRQGLVTAAQSTRAWIITGGTNTGVMKHVGKAISDHAVKHGSKKPLVALGIATWGCVENKDDLIDKTSKEQNQQPYFKGSWPAKYTNITTPEKKNESPLDLNHTHFILVDNGTQRKYGVEIQLRAKLESRISEEKTSSEESVSIPVVCVVLEGGPNTLETVKQAIDAGTPAIIVAGSGRAADILAYAYSKCTEKKVEVEVEDGLKQEASVPIFEDEEQLWKTVEEMIEKEFNMKDEEKIKKSVNQVRSCINKIDHMTVYRLDGGSSAKDIGILILKALLKVNRGTRIDQLRLALALNRVDVAKNEIFKDGVVFKDSELQNLMFPAIVYNRVDFVKFFLRKDVLLSEFLTVGRIRELYHHKSTPKRCPKLKILKNEEKSASKRNSKPESSEKEQIGPLLKHIGRLMEQLVGELFEPDYCDESKWKDLSANEPFRTINPMIEGLDSDDPARHLFLWSILTRNNDLAEIFWYEAKDDLALAVAAHLLLKGLLGQEPDPDETQELNEQITFWEEISVGLLTECYSSDQKKTAQLLKKELPYFGKTTTLKMAVHADNKKFVAHIACQYLLTDIWTGHLCTENHKLNLLLSVFCPPIAPVLLTYDDTERNQTSVTNGPPLAGSSTDKGGSQALEKHPNLKPHDGSATKKTCPAASCHFPSRLSVQSYFVKLYHFFQAPVIKFSYSCLSYFAFLLLFAIILLTDFYPTIHVKEKILIAWVITILMEEIRQITMDDAGNLMLKLYNYITDIWNILDVITIAMFIVGLILRFIPVSICAHCFFYARIILAFNFMAFYFRILQMFSIHRRLGPKLVMIGQMMIDLLYFMIIMLVFISAYGVASHVILYPNQPLDIALARDVLSRSWWDIFGELGLEEVSGDECNDTMTSEISAETCASLDYVEYDMAQCADYKDGKCPSIDWLVPIVLALYVLVTNVLMLNLLIAMFSNTFDTIQGQMNVVWKMQRYHLVREYDSRPMLPPPLIVLEHVYLFTRFLILRLRKYCKKGCCGKDSCNISEKESCCCGKDASKFRLRLPPSEEKDLFNWEHINADEFLRKREFSEQGSVENKAKEMSERVDEIPSTVEAIADTNFLIHSSGADVQSQLPPLFQKRFEILEIQMKHTTQALEWLIENAGSSKGSFKLPTIDEELQNAKEKTQRQEEEKIKIAKEKLEKTMRLHRFARESIYPKSSDDKSQCYRTQVPDEYVPWEVDYPDYKPEKFTDSSVIGTDVDLIGGQSFNQAAHQSWIIEPKYTVVDGFPRNPKGRTGLTGRGILRYWGPNHVVNVVITRWKKGEPNRLEFLSAKNRATDKQSIQEEETSYEETGKSDAVRQCFEKLLDNAKSAEELLFPREKEIFRGYLDDYRNTDNAWLETVVLNYHTKDEDDVKLGNIEGIKWMTIESNINVYGSHRLLLYRVARSLEAAF